MSQIADNVVAVASGEENTEDVFENKTSRDDSNIIQLSISTLWGELFSIKISRDSTIEELKNLIQQRTGVRGWQQTLFSNYKILVSKIYGICCFRCFNSYVGSAI